jgi:hypothetical protein
VSDGKAVRVLHASAAIGCVTYSPSQKEWATDSTEFTYGMRNADLTDQARAERSDYLSRHGWVASTVNMGQGRVQEMQISLAALGPSTRLALGYFVADGGTGSVMPWPGSITSGDGCSDEKLVRGHVPPRLRFEPKTWATVRMDP